MVSCLVVDGPKESERERERERKEERVREDTRYITEPKLERSDELREGFEIHCLGGPLGALRVQGRLNHALDLLLVVIEVHLVKRRLERLGCHPTGFIPLQDVKEPNHVLFRNVWAESKLSRLGLRLSLGLWRERERERVSESVAGRLVTIDGEVLPFLARALVDFQTPI